LKPYAHVVAAALTAFFSVSSLVFAQDAEPRFRDPAKRQAAVEALKREAHSKRQRAHVEAARRGWEVRKELPWYTYELVDVKDGNPVYVATDNANAAISTSVNLVRNTAPYNLNGSGLTVGVWDGGSILQTHQEFTGRLTSLDGASPHYHATHVGGTIGGAGIQANALGMAPSVTLDSYDWNSDDSEMAGRGASYGGESGTITVSNHSYGTISGWAFGSYSGNSGWHWFNAASVDRDPGFGRYTSGARGWDVIAQDAPYYLIFKSAGNDRNDAPSNGNTVYFSDGGWQSATYDSAVHPLGEGVIKGGYDTIGFNGNAKNIMTIGAANDAVSGGARQPSNSTITSFSGWGPSDDGRIKPDIVANGASLYSAYTGSDSSYASLSGTSMSSPNASGSAILLVQHFLNKTGHYMRSSTLKGLILHTATDIGRPGPDYIYGWGLMDTKAAADHITAYDDNPGNMMMIEDRLTDTDTSDSYTFAWDGSSAIRVTLCWIDPPHATINASDSLTPALVNDLDLRVTGPGSSTYDPYILDVANPANNATTGENNVDNVEQVYIANPGNVGNYTVTIDFDGTLDGNEQLYSLMISGGVQAVAAAAPTISTTTPGTGSPVTISGSGFLLGAGVSLRKTGETDVDAQTQSIVDDEIVVQIDSSGMAPGLWDIVVTNPDGQSASADAAYEVLNTVFSTDFSAGLPAGWTVSDGGSTVDTWTDTNPGSRSHSAWSGSFFICDSEHAGNGITMDESLITESFNLSALTSVTLNFSHYFRKWTSEICDVDVRISGGAWQNIARYQNSDASGNVSIDVSGIAANQGDVQFRWHYYDAVFEYYWGIDDVSIVGNLVNTPPVINAQSFEVFDDASNGDVVGQVVANDANNDSLSYSILNNTSPFSISNSGQLTVSNAAALDANVTPSYAITVEVDDGNGDQDTATITINVNAAPTIYNVGPAQAYATIGAVPIEDLNPGDIVRIHYQASPYAEKFVLGRSGTAAAPITIQGVANGSGDLPVITGVNATTRLALDYTNEDRGVIKIGTANVPNQAGGPEHIVIENLVVEGAAAGNSFTDDSGAGDSYRDSAAAIYIEASSNITIRNCELRNSNYGVFTSPANTYDLTITRCYLHSNGLSGSAERHNAYTQARGVIYNGNRFGALTAGGLGHNIKDRSSGTVIRYNWIEGGGRQIDMVDSEDAATYNSAEYAEAHVYGNILIEVGDEGNSQIVMFGGDSGQTARYRTGTLYFYNNTVISQRSTTTYFFRLDGGTVDCRNSIIYNTAAGNQLRAFFGTGTVNLRNNWIKNGWSTGTGGGTDLGGNITSGTDPGFADFASQDFTLANSTCVAQGTSQHANALPLNLQYLVHQSTSARAINNGGLDLGAFEASQNSAPTANAGGPYTGVEGANITLDGSNSSDNEGPIVSYAWDFDNDGQFDDATGVTPTFSNSVDGIYPIAIQVTDGLGATGTATSRVTLSNAAPTANAGGPYTGDEGANIALSAAASSDPGNDITSYEWDLDNNGSYETSGVNATFSTTLDGVYTVGLRVTDDDGGIGTTSTTVTVNNVAPTADAGGPYSVNEGGSVVLSAAGSSDPGNDIASYAWDLDNNGSYETSGATPTYNAGDNGSATVGLRVTDDDGDSGTSTATITINNVAPAVDANGPYNGNEGSAIAISASGSDYVGDTISYAWDLDGDGQYDDATGASISPSFLADVTIGVQASDEDGGVSTDTATVTVNNVLPTADIGGPYSGDEGSAISFDASASSDPGGIVSYAWDFDNDGQFDDATGATASHTFATDGSYPVSLRVTDNFGATDTDSTTVTVLNATPTADAGGPYTVELEDTVTLSAAGSSDPGGDALTYAWDLDNDGAYDDATGVTTTFTRDYAGSFTIGLRVEDPSGLFDTASTTVTVNYDVTWTNIVSATPNGNSLTRNAGSGWSAGASSRRALTEDGYLSVSASTGGKRMIGLSDSDVDAHFNTIDYCLYMNIGSLELYENGVQRGSFGPTAAGADLRITISRGDIIYSRDGVELRRVIGAVPLEGFSFVADASINDAGATISNVRLVTPEPEQPRIIEYNAGGIGNQNTFYSDGDTLEIIFHQKTDMGGYAVNQVLNQAQILDLFSFSTPPGTSYTGSWLSGDSFLINIQTIGAEPIIGTDTVQVAGTTVISHEKAPLTADPAAATLGDAWGSIYIEWTEETANLLVDGNKITRPALAGEGWNAGAVSSRSISRNGYFQTTVSMLGANRMIGFGKSNDSAHFDDIDYAFFLHVSGGLEAYESGSQTGNFGPVGIGTVLRMEIEGSTLRYLVNGNVRRTVTLPGNAFPLQVDTSLSGRNASFDNTLMVLEDPPAPQITSFVAADPDNGDIVYSVGDTFTINWDSPTDQPNATPTQLYTFSTAPGATYAGEWVDSSTYRITVTSTGSEPQIGVATVAATGSIPIYYENTRIQAATAATTLSGNYGRVRNEIRVAYANGLVYDLGRSYAISEVRLSNSGASAAINIQTSADGSSYTTANSATLGTETAFFDVGASARYVRITGIASLDDVRIYTEDALPATTWDHVDLRATITNGTITASFQAGKPYSVLGLLSEDPANLAAPAGDPVVVQTATANSVSTTYFYNDGSNETITWDFDGGDLRCSTNAETQLPGIDLTGRSLVTVDSDGVGVTSGARVNHRPIALVEGATDGWVIDGRGAGSFSYASPLSTSVSELRIREYSGGDWQSAVTPHRTALNLPAFSSPVRAYSTATNAALTPALTLVGPLTSTGDISTAAAAGYVVVADLASVTASAAITAGADVLYVANAASVAATQAANPGVPVMSTRLTAGAEFALLDNMGHALGGYLYKESVVVAPTGSMYAPTSIADIDAFSAWGCFLPAYGVDSWNAIVAAVQAGNIAPGDTVWESTATTRSVVLPDTSRVGTRHFNISSFGGPGAIAGWLLYNGNTLLGLAPASSYYFDPALTLDPAAFHISAIPGNYVLSSQTSSGYFKVEGSGNGQLDFVTPAGYVVYVDDQLAGPNHIIAGAATVRAFQTGGSLLHGAWSGLNVIGDVGTTGALVGQFPAAAGVNIQGSVSGTGSITINGNQVFSGTGAFDVDVSAYQGQNVLLEFTTSGTWTNPTIVLTGAPPVADIGGPYSTNEGSGITLDASNSFGAVNYAWDLDNDGAYDDAFTATVNFVRSADGSYPIGLQIDDGGGLVDTATTTVTVNNVAPVARIGGPYSAAPGVVTTFDASSSSDAGGDVLAFNWDLDGDGQYDDDTGATITYTAIAAGTITIAVEVSDGTDSSTDSTTFSASNDVVWTDIVNVSVNGNDLTKTGGNGWNAGAYSVGALEEDGYLKVTATIGGKRMIGLSSVNNGAHFSGITYALYLNHTAFEVYESGFQRGSFGPMTAGDDLRITLSRGDVIYSRNGVELRRLVGAVPLEGFTFYADASIDTPGATLQDVQLVIPPPENPRIIEYLASDADNFDLVYGVDDILTISFHQKTDRAGFAIDQVLPKATVDQLFTMTPAPGDDYTGSWTADNAFVVRITTPGSDPGIGSATVRPANGIIINNAKVALPAAADSATLSGQWGSIYVLWTNPINVLVEGNKLTRPSSAGEAWNGGAASSRTFTGDGHMETIVTQRGKNRMIGFSDGDDDPHFVSLNYAFFLHQSGALEAYENGVQRGYLSQYSVGDTLRLERSGSEMRYYINGLLRRSTTAYPALGLKVDCSLSAVGSTFDNTILVLGGARAATTAEAIRDAFTLHLDTGWNLIGIPLILDDPNPDFLDGQTAVAGHAYWVFVARPATHVLTGVRSSQPPIPGDGLYAPVRDSAIPDGYSAWSFADGIWRRVSANSALEAGRGYLLRAE
jgi:PKD repeat protein